jgi:type I restriction enzyme S subunit
MELKPGYKRTDAGIIPSDWDAVPLGKIGDALIGLTYRPEDVRPHGTLVLRASNIQNDKLAFDDNVYVGVEVPEQIMVRPGDVLVCVRNGSRNLIGKAALLDERCVGMTFGAFMAVHRGQDGRLVNFLFQSDILKRQINEHLGATINQITNRSLNAIRIPFPPTGFERESIGTALSDVDALLDGLDRLIAKKRDLKQGTMQQLLTGRTRLPGFKENWKHTRLGDHVSYLSHATHARAVLMTEGSVRYLHYGDVHAASSIWLDPQATPMPFVPERLAARFDRLETGDLVFVDASEDLTGIGKSVELRNAEGIEIIAGLHTITARFDKSVLADGFKGYLQFMPPFKAQLQRLAAGTKVYASSRSHVSSVEIELPDVKEQISIAEALNDMAAEITALERRRAKAQLLKQAMMQELLTGRTRLVETQGAIA